MESAGSPQPAMLKDAHWKDLRALRVAIAIVEAALVADGEEDGGQRRFADLQQELHDDLSALECESLARFASDSLSSIVDVSSNQQPRIRVAHPVEVAMFLATKAAASSASPLQLLHVVATAENPEAMIPAAMKLGMPMPWLRELHSKALGRKKVHDLILFQLYPVELKVLPVTQYTLLLYAILLERLPSLNLIKFGHTKSKKDSGSPPPLSSGPGTGTGEANSAGGSTVRLRRDQRDGAQSSDSRSSIAGGGRTQQQQQQQQQRKRREQQRDVSVRASIEDATPSPQGPPAAAGVARQLLTPDPEPVLPLVASSVVDFEAPQWRVICVDSAAALGAARMEMRAARAIVLNVQESEEGAPDSPISLIVVGLPAVRAAFVFDMLCPAAQDLALELRVLLTAPSVSKIVFNEQTSVDVLATSLFIQPIENVLSVQNTFDALQRSACAPEFARAVGAAGRGARPRTLPTQPLLLRALGMEENPLGVQYYGALHEPSRRYAVLMERPLKLDLLHFVAAEVFHLEALLEALRSELSRSLRSVGAVPARPPATSPDAVLERVLGVPQQLVFTDNGTPQCSPLSFDVAGAPTCAITGDAAGAIELIQRIFPAEFRDWFECERAGRAGEVFEIAVDRYRAPWIHYRLSSGRLDREAVAHYALQDWVPQLVDALEEAAGVFREDNVLVLPGQLHTARLIHSRGETHGLTIRVGVARRGCAAVLGDLMTGVARRRDSLVILGLESAAKTALLRDMAATLADKLGLASAVAVVDSVGELGGGGAITHAAIGSARRIIVSQRESVGATLLDAIAHHGAEVVVVDGVFHRADADAVRTAQRRGAAVVVAVASRDLADLALDSELRPALLNPRAVSASLPQQFAAAAEVLPNGSVRIYRDLVDAVERFDRGESILAEEREVRIHPVSGFAVVLSSRVRI